MDSDLRSLRLELGELGASFLQRTHFETDAPRARAALAEAIQRGAGNPLSYAISIFNSESFHAGPPRKSPAVNRHGRQDPRFTDDGERIWHANEVSDEWRQGHLLDCWQAFCEKRDPLARYQPSDEEFASWSAVMRRGGDYLPISVLNPSKLHTTAERALRAWAELWSVGLPSREEADPEPVLAPEPVLDEKEPVLA